MARDNVDLNDRRFTTGLGYFVLDLETGEVRQGVSRNYVDRLIRSGGVHAP